MISQTFSDLGFRGGIDPKTAENGSDQGFLKIPFGKMVSEQGKSLFGKVDTVDTILTMPFVRDDGGRATAGFVGTAEGDCVTRAIAIATRSPYRGIYDELNRRTKSLRQRGDRSGARTGIPRKVYEPFLFELGWLWTSAMHIGSGCTTHLRHGELPEIPVIARCSKHLTAVMYGVIHDIYDPSRDGTRCVYGWYEPGANA